MPNISLPEEILQIIWRYVYSDNVVSNISSHARVINKNLQLPRDSMMIYAVNHNVLRIMSGYGGLIYSS